MGFHLFPNYLTCEFDLQDYSARCKNCPKVGLQYEARQVMLLAPLL